MRWEHRVIEVDPASDKLEEQLNEYGRAGWELISVVPTYSTEWTNVNENQTDVHVGAARAIFKREYE